MEGTNWFSRNFKTIIYVAFLVPIITVAIVSISHVTSFYGITNPFDFMEGISIEGKTNFFEKRVSEYSLSQGGDRTKAFNFETTDF